jgi:hypothetical protein
MQNLPDEAGINIDLGTGMFDIPVEQSVTKVIDLLKKAEAKVGAATPTRQMTGDADTDFMGEGFNLFKKMKDYAGEQGWTFSARRPTEEEDEIGREYMRSQGKELGSIGVDRLTGNINVMEPNGDFRAILSPEGEELSAYEMDIHENIREHKKKEKDIEIDINSAEQITLKGKELDSEKLGTNKKYRDIILKAPDKAFMYKGKPVSITAVDLNDGSVDEPKIYLTVLNESIKTTQTLKSTKPGDKLTLVLDDNSTITVVRIGSNKSGEPTFKHLQNNKEVGTASALSASHIKSIKSAK